MKFEIDISRDQLPAIGSSLAGGFYTGIIQTNDKQYALITSPKSLENKGKWGKAGIKLEGATSTNNCAANTLAMAESSSELARQIMLINHDGFNDWAIPSRDALEMQYRAFKPTGQNNYCTYRDGDNPSSVPPGFLYTKESPAQTAAEIFQEGHEQEFFTVWYWSSTQYGANTAYGQAFSDGHQDSEVKVYSARVRPVRRLLII